MYTSSVVLASRYAFPMSVAHVSNPLSSARNSTNRKPRRETTPEYTLSNGVSVKCPFATHLVL